MNTPLRIVPTIARALALACLLLAGPNRQRWGKQNQFLFDAMLFISHN